MNQLQSILGVVALSLALTPALVAQEKPAGKDAPAKEKAAEVKAAASYNFTITNLWGASWITASKAIIARLDGVESVTIKDSKGFTTVTMKDGKTLTEQQVKDALATYKKRVFGLKDFKAAEAKKDEAKADAPAKDQPKKEEPKKEESK